MSKKNRTLIILAVVLLILSVALFIVLRQPDEVMEEVPIKEIILFDTPFTDVNSVTMASADGDAFTLVKEEGEWLVKGAENEYKLEQTQINTMVYGLTRLNALSIVEEIAPDDLSPYGLKNPDVVTAIVQDSENLAVYIGSKTTGNSYYAMVDNDTAIYEINASYGKLFTMKLNDFRVLDIMNSINIATLERLVIKRSDMDIIEMIVPEDNQEGVGYRLTSHVITQPFKQSRDIRDERVSELLTSINTFAAAKEIAEDAPEDMSKYGLDKPSIELAIKDSTQDIVLLFGDMSNEEDNIVYCMLQGESTVFKAYAAELENLKTIDAFSLASRFVFLANIVDIDEIKITGYDSEYRMKIDRENSKNDADEDGQPDTADTYYINDIQIAEDDFKDAYQLIIGLYADALAEDKTDADDVKISIEYINNLDDFDNDIVEFVPYNEFFYAVYVNGINEFVVAVNELEKLFDGLDELLQ